MRKSIHTWAGYCCVCFGILGIVLSIVTDWNWSVLLLMNSMITLINGAEMLGWFGMINKEKVMKR
jgi:hypothetical protein